MRSRDQLQARALVGQELPFYSVRICDTCILPVGVEVIRRNFKLGQSRQRTSRKNLKSPNLLINVLLENPSCGHSGASYR